MTSPLRRRQQANTQRNRSGMSGLGRDVPIPLPIGGLFSEAKNAEMNVSYSGEMINWRSNGAALETRPSFNYDTEESTVLQRIPYEFASKSLYLEITSDRISAGFTSFTRPFNGRASFGEISSNTIIADGLANPLRFDGGTFQSTAFTTSTGVTQSDFDGFVAHHDRPYFWKRGGTLEFYYGGVGAVTGELTRFPLDRLGNIRGTIQDIVSLTVDAGHGMNDVLAIFTSTGDMVLYEGLDPGDSNDWRLLSRPKIAAPLGKDCFTQVGTDLWVLTSMGVVSVAETLSRGAMSLVGAFTRPITDEIVCAVEMGGEWRMHTAADQTMVIIGRTYEGAPEQWVYYTESQTWAKSDYPASSWHNLGKHTQFTTTTGRLATLSRLMTGGESMTATFRTGWFRASANSLDSITPTIIAESPLSIRLAVLVDHDETPADLEESWQTFTVEPETAATTSGQKVALNEPFGIDAVGEVYQLRMEIAASWAQIVNITAKVV